MDGGVGMEDMEGVELQPDAGERGLAGAAPAQGNNETAKASRAGSKPARNEPVKGTLRIKFRSQETMNQSASPLLASWLLN